MLDSEKGTRSAVAEGAHPSILNSVRQADCDAAIWQRRLPSELNSWLTSLQLGALQSARLSARWPTLEKVAAELCRECSMPEGRGRSLFISDIAHLSQLFMDASCTNAVNLRLDVVSGNACHKFHQDYVTARLLCTYRGAGTQYGYPRGDGIPDHVHQMSEGHVGLFRGRLWGSSNNVPLLHRSPPISGTGERRLLLVIDPQDTDE